MILSYIRTVVLYLILIAVIRLMGKRQIGEMEPAEFVVTMLVANLAAIPMQDGAIPLYSGLVPILTMLGMQLVLSWVTLRSVKLRRLLCGKPMLLIDNGKILQQNLRAARITLDELTGHLRSKDVLDVNTVQFAVLETDGSLSVFPFPQEQPAAARDAGIKVPRQQLPLAIIEDGWLSRENLKKAGKDESWVREQLRAHGASTASTFLLMVDCSGNPLWLGKEHAT